MTIDFSRRFPREGHVALAVGLVLVLCMAGLVVLALGFGGG